MEKTNKELAVDIAIEYVHGMLHVESKEVEKRIPVEECCEIIKTVHRTLEEIDNSKENNMWYIILINKKH